MSLKTHDVQCPYCGETIEIDVEHMEETQAFIEDCTVCCRPIQYHVNPAIDEESDDEVVVSRSE